MSGAASARRYNRDEAKHLADGLDRILDRINRKTTPIWMLKELDVASRRAQCIQREFEMTMKEFGDKEVKP
jgi:hypothetical protein